MDRDLEERVRNRAYEIWEREGRCGDPAAHWHWAEQELAQHAADDREEILADLAEDTLRPDWMAALDSAVSGFMRGVASHRRRRRAAAVRSPGPSATPRRKTAA
jgi:hypothetical protein